MRLLDRHSVRYVVVGGYALGYHGYVRATGDLDIFIEVSEDNADRLVIAFQEFGFSQNMDKNLFLKKSQILRAGRPPMRLEILSEISGVSFEECYENRESVPVEDFTVHFINLETLIKNKKSTGRPKDAVDVDFLIKSRKSDRSLEE
ncbi:MAG: hypothetical protein O3C20_22560 [Verrucomicrobia bacterium]|nr:hypothetical protein [Verrucomicrobiota bacterium]